MIAGATASSAAPTQALLPPYFEQDNKFDQSDMNDNVNSGAAVHASSPAETNANLPARTGGDISINCGHSAADSMHIGASSYHAGGVNSRLADGSVRFFRDATLIGLWRATGTRAGGEAAIAN